MLDHRSFTSYDLLIPLQSEAKRVFLQNSPNQWAACAEQNIRELYQRGIL